MKKIEIEFPMDVEALDGFEQCLTVLIDTMICMPYERANPTRVMWPTGQGCKPNWSVVDAAFLGKTPEPGAPESGEPTFDDSVYFIEVAEREADERTLARREQAKEMNPAKQDGASLIAAERQRQIEVEGWTPEHDDEHDDGSLAAAGACYAMLAAFQACVDDIPDKDHPVPADWPWDVQWWNPKDRLSNLVRAGALNAAEIDRELRLRARLAGTAK